MEAPYVIATLPSPLDKEQGKTYAAPVYALRGARKRKRHEVAVAVDGEGINIYNVQTQAAIASYPVPPQTYFCSRPCSIVCRVTADKAAQRRTYVVVKDGATRTNHKLLCFTENVRGRRGGHVDYYPPEKLDCTIPDGEIRTVDIVASESGEPSCVRVAYANGHVISALKNLARPRPDRAAFVETSSQRVEYSAIVDWESARKGLLRGREDILAGLEQTSTDGAGSNFACEIVQSGGVRRLDLSIFQGRSEEELQSTRSSMRPVVSFELPNSGAYVHAIPQHDVHAASARVYSLSDNKLTVYDLSSTIPRILTEFGPKTAPLISFTRLSTSMVVAASASVASVYETKYGSLQASGTLTVAPATSVTSKKRKRDSNGTDDVPASPIAVSAFLELGLFVFLHGTQLVAIQLPQSFSSVTQRQDRPARLADVIGHGVGEHRIAGIDISEARTSDWSAQVDDLVDSGDIEALEALVANDGTLGRQRKPEKFRRKGPSDSEELNGDAAAYDDLWPLPEPLDATKLDRERVLYILGKVFSYALDEPRIEIRIASYKLLEWLALTGHLSHYSLQKALRSEDSGVQGEPIRPGDIMTAICEIDEDFQLMHNLLSLPTHWELPEIIQALCLLLRSFDATPESADQDEPTLALSGISATNGDTGLTNGDIEMTNSDSNHLNGHANSDLESESRAAETELEHVERLLMSGLEVRSDTLRIILERLHAFPACDVTATMRRTMTQKELVFFIHMLRIELADGGWTSRYVDAGPDEEGNDEGDVKATGMIDVIPADEETEFGPSNQAIVAIGDLLNCAVDAVGTSGWLVGLSGDALGTEELLDSLRAEVSAGLEGCYEASTLGTFLEDLERFVASKPKPRKGQAEEEITAILPVGGRAEPTQLKSKGKKSKHLIALEKSKRVGKYSLDRIRF